MSQNATKTRLEDLEIKPHLITKLKGAGIESIFDLAISIPHHLIEEGGADAESADPEDRKIIRRLIEKALEINIKRTTGKKMMHGIFLLEDPIPLYRCEKAKLYVGFSVRSLTEKVDGGIEEAIIELSPQAYVRESVLDYVNLRRERGASANAISQNLTTYRNRVIVAPSGNYGSISDVIMRKAGNQKVSDSDNRNLVEFWQQIYDIDISPDEIPLLKDACCFWIDGKWEE